MGKYVVKFEPAYFMLTQYLTGNLDDTRLSNMMGLLRIGCIKLMIEYVGMRNTESPHDWKEIDSIYVPAIKKELSKLKIFDMSTCSIHVRAGSANGHYSTILIQADLTDIASDINYVKIKNPENYSALMDFTKEKVPAASMLKF